MEERVGQKSESLGHSLSGYVGQLFQEEDTYHTIRFAKQHSFACDLCLSRKTRRIKGWIRVSRRSRKAFDYYSEAMHSIFV